MAELGSFVLLLALALSGYSFLAGLAALTIKHPGAERLGETARRAGIASFGAVFLGALVLVVSAFRNDFSIAYILHHSNRDLPWPYKFATLWSGQEGSLLFWSLLLSTYGLVLRLRHKTDERLFAHASVIIAAVQVFFFLLLNFAAKPFALMEGTIPADGNGLAYLKDLPDLQRLDLSWSRKITDAGLAHLRGLMNLKDLTVGETKVTDKGIAAP